MQYKPHDSNYASYQIEYWEAPLSREWPLHILCVEEVTRSKPTKLLHIRQEFLLLAIILDGSLRFQFRDEEALLCAGDVTVVPEMTEYGFESFSTGGHYQKLVAEIRGVHLGSLAGTLGITRPEIFRGRAATFLPAVKAAQELLKHRDPVKLPELLGVSYQLLGAIALEHAEPETPEDRLLNAAQLLLEQDFQQLMPISQIAKRLGISHSRLDRLFRDKLDESPQGYRIRKKMERAARLLHTALSVKEAAYLLGYCNQFHFSSEFKRFHGVSPQVFQRSIAD